MMKDDIVEELRDESARTQNDMFDDAANLIQSQAKRIEELEKDKRDREALDSAMQRAVRRRSQTMISGAAWLVRRLHGLVLAMSLKLIFVTAMSRQIKRSSTDEPLSTSSVSRSCLQSTYDCSALPSCSPFS